MAVAVAVLRRRVEVAEVSQVDYYNQLDFDREELAAAMRAGYDRIIAFISTSEFKALNQELRSLAPEDRPNIVSTVVLEPAELAKRGIVVSEDFSIQTSAFGDRRPTLFAVKLFLPAKFHKAWENANYTFNNEFLEEEVTTDPEMAWRSPLPVGTQNLLISKGNDLDPQFTKIYDSQLTQYTSKQARGVGPSYDPLLSGVLPQGRHANLHIGLHDEVNNHFSRDRGGRESRAICRLFP